MPTSKKPAKAMDVVHPSDTAPDTTGRPVIITNRPYMKVDPMLSVASGDGAAAASDQEKPTQDSLTPSATAPLIGQTKTVALVRDGMTPTESVEEPVATTIGYEAGTQESASAFVTESKPMSELEPEPKSEPQPAEPTKDSTQEVEQHPASVAENITGDEGVTAEREDEIADDAEQSEVERHIAAGTYFVPIGQVKRRRQKIVLFIFFVLVLVVVAVDVLLDMGIITVSGIPHTSLFK